MKSASPLRYPGGKSAMSNLLAQIRKINGFGSRPIAEPFAGGAGASLLLLYREEASEIYINDLDPAIYDFWCVVTNQSRPFIDKLKNTKVDISEWYQQKEIYSKRKRASQLHRAFATFYLNRCNRSGIIINGGPIGGVKQTGKWKIDARFNKDDLQKRCEKIAKYRNRIHISCRDGIEFIKSVDAKSVFFFIDPPYFINGPKLYLNTLDRQFHINLSNELKSMQHAAWVLTYDDCPEIRHMYKSWANIQSFSLRYSAADRRSGQEIMIVPKWMQLPESQKSTSLIWKVTP